MLGLTFLLKSIELIGCNKILLIRFQLFEQTRALVQHVFYPSNELGTKVRRPNEV